MAVQEGDVVKVEYEGKLESGEVFDSSRHGDHSHPLEFEVGKEQVIRGFEEAVKGMEKGEKKYFEILPEEGYGMRRDDLKREVPKDSIPPSPEGQELKAGMVLMVGSAEGGNFPVRIDEVREESIVLDLNHPLAGKGLVFSVEVVDIQKSGEKDKS